MGSKQKGRLFRRVFTLFSAVGLSLLASGGLSKFALAQSPTEGRVLGIENDVTIVNVIPNRPKATSIFKPKSVEIRYKDSLYKGITYSNTVEEAVRDFGIEISSITQLHPDGNYILGVFTSIRVDEVVRKNHTEYEYISFETEERKDDNLEWGVRSVTKPGVIGQKKMVYEYLYINDLLMGKKLVNEIITLPSENEIVSIGTKKVYKTTVIGGVEITYWRVIEGMRATSYDRYCTGCTGHTYTGKILEKGMVAVDPTVIPLGTHLYVPGYGSARAEDIGGAVKGNRIDLGFDKIEDWYGKVSYGSYVDVYVLD
ncbi:MAG: G5 domain-containing protein [bacterium]